MLMQIAVTNIYAVDSIDDILDFVDDPDSVKVLNNIVDQGKEKEAMETIKSAFGSNFSVDANEFCDYITCDLEIDMERLMENASI